MDEKGKGISLRQKRGGKIKISGPTLISGPINQNGSTSIAGPRLQQQQQQQQQQLLQQQQQQQQRRPDDGLPGNPRPRPRPADDSRTADMVKRRYSTRFAGMQDYDVDAPPPLPMMPSILPNNAQYAVQHASRPPVRGEGRPVKIDQAALTDPSFNPENCKHTQPAHVLPPPFCHRLTL
jgi:hypothetical protein